MRPIHLLSSALLLGALGCSSSSTDPAADPDATFRQNVTNGMHDTLSMQIAAFLAASKDLKSAAPVTAGRGWDATEDAAAMTSMVDAWKRVRDAYEHIEGAIAPLFPEIDFAVDARYDDFLTELNGQGDDNPFDGAKVTGQHAIERILFVGTTPPTVIEFEKALPGYKAATLPLTEKDATDFKDGLCEQMIADVIKLQTEWQPAKIDLGGAFTGLISLMNEQSEKVNKAATQEEESRYAQRTLADLHANLDGTITAYNLFKPWIVSKGNGVAIDGKIQEGFQALRTAYDKYPGDAIPQPPATWSSQNPTPADLETDFGKLYTAVQQAADPGRMGSVVEQMNAAAKLLGFPGFTETP
jgi:iron uptake system component EfeO